jgi:hypothetical protein
MEWVSSQGGLEILAATHPGSEVADLCEAVIERGTELLKKLHVAVVDGKAQPPEWWEDVSKLWAETIAKAPIVAFGSSARRVRGLSE